MGDGIWIHNFPMPPPDNQLYRNVQGIGRVKAQVYKDYQKKVDQWGWQNQRLLLNAITFCSLKPLLSLIVILRVPRSSLWTKKHTVKRWDATNRLKALCDCLSKLLEIDDSHFFHVSVQKVPMNEEEGVDMHLEVHSMWDSTPPK